MIKLIHVKKDYTEGGVVTNALKDINLEVKDGEFVAIMGASGSGKSTLLHILGGMDKLTSGEYYYNDEAVHDMSMGRLNIFRRDHVSFVFQNAALMKYYTVAENIEMPLLSMNIGKKERKKIIEEKMEAVGIAHLAKKLPIHISGGEQTRTAIARALAGDNELLLADEPTGALDQTTGKEIMEVFKKVHEMGKTIILITHDPNVAAYADRIIRIEDGKIIN
ncbi:ABC transporter ATP-binding protein [Eshraghiella crossota]|jgi:putative ABC transport system ATP-binding protein|uniref:ABC transporter, ATP-binding protein n=2 Tax=Eshraghiella TaxID=3342669 RepID=D4RYD6_9FIRM|nr:ABC transporter ATP-binding protein [Butyrivibrio crossotus]EFF69036.1 ABC transporter, ATP-binding protein [Butyrivibrio crossotus DSM 2876]UWO50854.1 ABC transporter ATP-binding protein [Butyrivibrio crossotus]